MKPTETGKRTKDDGAASSAASKPSNARNSGTASRGSPGELAGSIAHAGFKEAVSETLEALRDSLARLIARLPGDVRRGADLARTMDLDAALAWQIHSLATMSDPIGAGRFVPKAGAMDRFLKEARKRRVEESIVEAVERAHQRFERLVDDHAGDRETFEAMISAMRPGDGSTLQRIRRSAFRANSSVWGIASRCMIHTVVFRGRPTGEVDCLGIRGRIALSRFQESALLSIYATSRTWGGSATPPDGAPRVAVDRCELLENYCSTPVPRIDHVPVADGSTRDFLRLEGLGRTAKVTLYWRNLSLGFPGGSPTPPHGLTSVCNEPSELLIADLLVPKGWSTPSTVKAWMAPDSARSEASGLQGYRLPFEGAAEYLGQDLARLRHAEAPRYDELMTDQIKELGWGDTVFDLYRCVVPYPALHSGVNLCVE